MVEAGRNSAVIYSPVVMGCVVVDSAEDPVGVRSKPVPVDRNREGIIDPAIGSDRRSGD